VLFCCHADELTSGCRTGKESALQSMLRRPGGGYRRIRADGARMTSDRTPPDWAECRPVQRMAAGRHEERFPTRAMRARFKSKAVRLPPSFISTWA